jgi:hypothetical protein
MMNGDKPSVYGETTIVSYLAARPSRDALLGAHQAITHDWWALRANYACTARSWCKTSLMRVMQNKWLSARN